MDVNLGDERLLCSQICGAEQEKRQGREAKETTG